MDDAPGVTPQPGDAVVFEFDDGTPIPATVLGRRHGGYTIRIDAQHLRIATPAITTVPPDRLTRRG